MLKKRLLFIAGILILATISLCNNNYPSRQISLSNTYQLKNTSNTYQLQKLADETSDTILPAAGSWKSDFPSVNDSNVLGIAGQFNYFAKNIDSISNNLNGNVATQNLKTSGGSQTGNSGISYLQKNIESSDNAAAFKSDTLILGSSLVYKDKIINDSRPSLNGYKLNQKPNKLRQDTQGSEYLNFDSEFARLENNSKAIANNSTTVSTGGNNNLKIDASNVKVQQGVKYVTIKATDFGSWGSLTIDGVANNERIVITLDRSGVTNFSTGWLNLNNGENKNILFNSYDVAQNSNYTGNIEWKPSSSNAINAILAPKATFTLVSSNFQGNIVASKIINRTNTNTVASYGDVPVPSETSITPTSKIISVPDVDFGSHKLGSETSLVGDWTGNFQVSGKKNTQIKINVALTQQLTSQNGSVADGIHWQLVKNDYSSGSLITTSQDFTNISARINYWIWKDDGTGNLLSDWKYNNEKKQYGSYNMQISNLDTVTEAGDYTATLNWTLVDGP